MTRTVGGSSEHSRSSESGAGNETEIFESKTKRKSILSLDTGALQPIDHEGVAQGRHDVHRQGDRGPRREKRRGRVLPLLAVGKISLLRAARRFANSGFFSFSFRALRAPPQATARTPSSTRNAATTLARSSSRRPNRSRCG